MLRRRREERKKIAWSTSLARAIEEVRACRLFHAYMPRNEIAQLAQHSPTRVQTASQLLDLLPNQESCTFQSGTRRLRLRLRFRLQGRNSGTTQARPSPRASNVHNVHRVSDKPTSIRCLSLGNKHLNVVPLAPQLLSFKRQTQSAYYTTSQDTVTSSNDSQLSPISAIVANLDKSNEQRSRRNRLRHQHSADIISQSDRGLAQLLSMARKCPRPEFRPAGQTDRTHKVTTTPDK